VLFEGVDPDIEESEVVFIGVEDEVEAAVIRRAVLGLLGESKKSRLLPTFDQGPQALSLETDPFVVDAEIVEDCRHDVQVLDRSVEASAIDSGNSEDQGYAGEGVPYASAMADVAVFQELLSMVRRKDDDCFVELAEGLQAPEQPTEDVVEVTDLVVVEIDEVLDVTVRDLDLGAVGVQHLRDGFRVALLYEIEPVVRARKFLLVFGMRLIVRVWLHVVEVEKERLFQTFQHLEDLAVDACAVLPHAAFDESVEAPSKSTVRIERARRVTNDGARRYGDSVVPVTIEDFGDCRVRLRNSEVALSLAGEDVRVA